MINKERTDQDRALDSGYSPTVLESAYPAMTWRRRVVLFLPILAVLGAAALFGPWMLRVMTEFAARLLGNLHHFAG